MSALSLRAEISSPDTNLNARQQQIIAVSELAVHAAPQARGLRLRKDLGQQREFIAELPPHGCIFIRVKSRMAN